MGRSGFYLAALLVFSVTACTKKSSDAEVALSTSVSSGEKVYKQYCLTCHQIDGGGAPPMNPSLIKTSFVLGTADKLVPVVLNGMSGQEIDGEYYQNIMPPLTFLTDKEIADVLTYVRNSFGNTAPMITEGEVKVVRDVLGQK